MAKQEPIKMTGTVTEALPNTMFRVMLDMNQDMIVLCTLCGKMQRNHIRVMAGDRVELEMSPYDLTRGRITLRIRNSNN